MKTAMKTVLVTGATGFVGSHVLETLMQDPSLRVIAACRSKARLLPGFAGEVREGDLRDAAYRGWVVQGVDVVCHCAAWSSLWGQAAASRALFLEPSLALIEAARSAGVRRFINISSTSAAAPEQSRNPMSRGIARAFWPHLVNVVAIEDALRARASERFGVVNLRLGIFSGRRYALGVLPILLPRLKTHLVPWVNGGRTSLPMIDGRDIGQAFYRAVQAEGLAAYEGFNIVGPEVPTVREVIDFVHARFGYPRPHFSVPFAIAYPFAWLMERLDPLVPWEPLVTRSIIHLLEETHADNQRAEQRIGYRPQHHWQQAIELQVAEMQARQDRPMKMYRPMETPL